MSGDILSEVGKEEEREIKESKEQGKKHDHSLKNEADFLDSFWHEGPKAKV